MLGLHPPAADCAACAREPRLVLMIYSRPSTPKRIGSVFMPRPPVLRTAAGGACPSGRSHQRQVAPLGTADKAALSAVDPPAGRLRLNQKSNRPAGRLPSLWLDITNIMSPCRRCSLPAGHASPAAALRTSPKKETAVREVLSSRRISRIVNS